MAVRDDFSAGEVLAAADLNDTFAAKLDLAGGKILQIVRATDGTNRSTTSNSEVDATISVTVTPQKSDSAVMLLWTATCRSTTNASSNESRARLRITDASNNPISGASAAMGYSNTAVSSAFDAGLTVIGYSTPATTSAVTYKGRFNVYVAGGGCTLSLLNSQSTGQMFAIEVSA